ncbi:ABC transporter ATP-binding protein [Kocuria sp.]|uniref:ABC transporter ATP-binding protein n=1 Tax=Kocuria sp. TaxID=1871328 RepID=UPI0026DA7C9C|nr:ABC transporter ATP-binding protein [Kocuria sp.]MDO4919662.1 ABC transporter ATP-binding protein [Kocuria sp.]
MADSVGRTVGTPRGRSAEGAALGSWRATAAELTRALGLLGRPYRAWMVGAVLGSLGIAALDMLGVAATLPLMRLVTGAGTDTGVPAVLGQWLHTRDTAVLIVAMAAVICCAFLVKSLLTVGFRWWLLGHSTAMGAEAGAELFRRYMASSYADHRRRRLSEVHRALSSAVPQTFNQLIMGLLTLVPDLLTLVAVSIVLFVSSPWAAVLAVVFFGSVSLATQRVLRPAQRRIALDTAASDLAAWDALMPGVNGFRESRLTGTAQRFVTAYAQARAENARASRRMALVSELPKYVLEIALVVGVALVAALLFALMEPEPALSVLGVFAVAAVRMIPVLNRALATTAAIRAGAVGLEILGEQLADLAAGDEHRPQRGGGPPFAGDIELRDVAFAYPDAPRPVLDGVSTRIRAGTTVAFVGGSGAGKSTLLDLVLGLLRPTRGAVTCGGRDILEDVGQWHSQIGVVPQDVFLMDATVRANIAYGLEDHQVDDAALARAVERADLAAIVAELPEGLETRLGERGVRLSGGQRQRVGIARALYRDPDVLVLDEATSALDNVTEDRITRTIDSLRGDMTILVVAHRLSTVKHADRLMFMADGRIVSEGSFTDLLRESGEFARLVELGRLA